MAALFETENINEKEYTRHDPLSDDDIEILKCKKIEILKAYTKYFIKLYKPN